MHQSLDMPLDTGIQIISETNIGEGNVSPAHFGHSTNWDIAYPRTAIVQARSGKHDHKFYFNPWSFRAPTTNLKLKKQEKRKLKYTPSLRANHKKVGLSMNLPFLTMRKFCSL